MKPIKYNNINEDEFLKLLPNSNSMFFKGINSKYFNHKFGIIDTRNFVRESKDRESNYHFYDELLNECEAWQNMPKRRHSIIGTSSHEIASLYALGGDHESKVYFVIPLDAKSILCPTEDILTSFNNSVSPTLMNVGSNSFLLQLNQEFKTYFERLNLSENQIRALKYSDLCVAFNSINESVEIRDLPIVKHINEGNSFEDFINKVLDPKKNFFEGSLENKILSMKGSGKEVFSSGEVLLCEYSEMKKFGLVDWLFE